MYRRYILFSAFFILGILPILAQEIPLDASIPCFYSCEKRDSANAHIPCCHAIVADVSIKRIQIALNRQGYSLKVDGILGKKTQEAFIDIQRRIGSPVFPHAAVELFAELGIFKVIK